jgi:hypothetical protein
MMIPNTDHIEHARAEAMAHLGAALNAMNRAAKHAVKLAENLSWTSSHASDDMADLAKRLDRDARMIAMVAVPPPEPIHPDVIAEAVCKRFGVSVAEVRYGRRNRRRILVDASITLARVMIDLRRDMGFPGIALWAGQPRGSHSSWCTRAQHCNRRPDLLRIADEVIQELRR